MKFHLQPSRTGDISCSHHLRRHVFALRRRQSVPSCTQRPSVFFDVHRLFGVSEVRLARATNHLFLQLLGEMRALQLQFCPAAAGTRCSGSEQDRTKCWYLASDLVFAQLARTPRYQDSRSRHAGVWLAGFFVVSRAGGLRMRSFAARAVTTTATGLRNSLGHSSYQVRWSHHSPLESDPGSGHPALDSNAPFQEPLAEIS